MFWKTVDISFISFESPKLLRTKRGATWNSRPGDLGDFCMAMISLAREYVLTWKDRVGPRGTREILMLVPCSVLERITKWVTPNGPATATKSLKRLFLRS